MRTTRRMPRLLASWLLFSAALVPVARAQDAARAVEDLERELVAAISKTDLATYDRIVADDYVVVEATGRDIPKSEVIASYRSGTRHYTNLEIFDVHGRVFGDTAIVAARTKGFRREDGKDVPNDVRYVRVYARREGRWRAVAQMSTPFRPAS